MDSKANCTEACFLQVQHTAGIDFSTTLQAAASAADIGKGSNDVSGN